MARAQNKLSARMVASIKKPGRHSDGGGLYLVVDKAGSRRWAFLYRWNGRLREMGLGGLLSVSLAEARDEADRIRRLLAKGADPIQARKEDRGIPTFGELADEVLASLRPSFRNAKHAAQWEYSLNVLAAPLREIRVDELTTDQVLRVLKPLWNKVPETAARLRGRIERVIDAAKAKGLRQAENPAVWRGHLAALLPKRHHLTRGHHAALPHADLPAFVADLQAREGMAALALEWTIITAARSGETLGATWDEIDLGAKVWTIPAARMKAGREHRVPLSPRALEILAEAHAGQRGPFLFPGPSGGRLSIMSMAMLLRRMNVTVTVHGFRSTFRDWAAESTSFPRELIEAALAHAVGDQTERAYFRSDVLQKRAKVMDAWAGFARARDVGNVVALGGRRG